MKEKIHESDCVSCAKKRRLPKDKKELAVEVQKHLEDIFNSDNKKSTLPVKYSTVEISNMNLDEVF